MVRSGFFLSLTFTIIAACIPLPEKQSNVSVPWKLLFMVAATGTTIYTRKQLGEAREIERELVLEREERYKAKADTISVVAKVRAETEAEQMMAQQYGNVAVLPPVQDDVQPVKTIETPTNETPTNEVKQPEVVVTPVSNQVKSVVPSRTASNIKSEPPGFNIEEKNNTTKAANFAERLGMNPKCFMILGVPGSGKGMLVSNAIRAMKPTKPHIKIVGVDPKDDPKETGYWSEGFDDVFRKNAERMDDIDFLKWVKGCVNYFKKLPDGKLLVFDEITATFNRWSRLENSSFESFMVDYCTSVSSSGDSRENYVWLIGQIPHASALGVDGGIRSIYKPVAVVSKYDKRATDTFLRTNFIPKAVGGNKAVYEVMERSPRGRAVYDYTLDQWVPMEELTNYSGYDRDSRKKIESDKSEESKPEQVLKLRANGAKLGDAICQVYGCDRDTEEFENAKSDIMAIFQLT